MSVLQEIITTYLPTKRKQTPSGWISFNAVCCQHNGHSIDKRGRGGIILKEEGVSYHCFNCGFKCSWQPGNTLSFKMKKLLSWMQIEDDIIAKVGLQLIKDSTANIKIYKNTIPSISFEDKQLPLDFIPLDDVSALSDSQYQIMQYLVERNLYLEDTQFYFSSSIAYKDRLIIPFYFSNNLVGWTARSIKNKTPKYITQSQPGFIYNYDKQTNEKQCVIVCEGPFDALHIQGASILGSEISAQQLLLLKKLDKEIIVVPDRDKAGKKLLYQSLDLDFSISMPNWNSKINDVSDAVNKYGRALTLHSIIQAKQNNKLKIKLGIKKWFS